MFGTKSSHLLVFWYLVSTIRLSRTEFSDYVLMKDNDKYIFSKTLSSYDEAERNCNAIGGEIVQISDDTDRNFFSPSLTEFYLKNTSEVQIWRGAGFACDIRSGSSCWIAFYKFRQASGTNNDSSPLTYNANNMYRNFTRDSFEWDLSSIRLFRRATGNFTEIVRFCWTREADKVASTCSGNYKQNFQLYGGNQQTTNTIMLYNVKVRNFNVTSRLNFSHVGQEIFDSPSRIYLPDISVFIGARSEIGQTTWIWNNGTNVTDPKFPSSNVSECQQMTWPLTYKYLHEDRSNLRIKPCCRGLAYSICTIKSSKAISTSQDVNNSAPNVNRKCQPVSNSGQTLSATVQNDGNGGCWITWNHNFTHQVISYRITIMSESGLIEFVNFDQENARKSIQNSSYTVDVSSFVNNMNNTHFAIQAFLNNNFKSSIVNVSGFCVSSMQEYEMSTISSSNRTTISSSNHTNIFSNNSQPTNVVAAVTSVVIVVVILSSILGYFIYKKKRKLSKNSSVQNHYDLNLYENFRKVPCISTASHVATSKGDQDDKHYENIEIKVSAQPNQIYDNMS